MLKELGSCIDPSDDERQLIDKLRSFLQDKRYFIVVDDIWSLPAWELVMSALPENNLNSRIITTTRIDSVAQSCCSSLTGYVHNIKPLSVQQSHELFFKRLGDSSARPLQLEEMSHRILKKCHGLPLAIITIASLLAGKSDKDQWEHVCNSMGSAFSHRGMRDILLLSYYDLPRHLKTCLLYLSMYPEDYMIDREELIWRWIAEGFVTEVWGRQTVDQVAESYLNELVNRSLIQPIRIQYDGRVEFCRVHDVVLELIVSLSVKENFATIAEEHNGGDLKIRRLSVQSEQLGDGLIQEIMDKWSQVRSISFYGLQELRIPYLEKLNSLRVFVSKNGCRLGNQHVKYIGSFFQLTFLGISAKGITELPEDIGDLRYLQTLDIRRSGIKKLPTSISRLQNLMRLLVSLRVELPDKIGDLQTLQELSFAQNYSIKFLEELGRLTRLKTLGISMAEDREQFGCDVGRYKEALKLSLAAMGEHGLQSLQIFNSNIVQELMDILCCTVPCLRKLDICGYRINNSLPKQMASFANLTYLGLLLTRIKQEDIYILGELPSLLYTGLHVDHSPGERLTFSSQHFRCLKEFEFLTYAYGGGLEMLFLQEAMPELRRLTLTFRAEETESKAGFEFCFKHLASLEHIEVGIRRDNATRSRMEAAEAAVRNAVSIHPGCPILHLSFFAPRG
ncbi:unnamed protein product [Urochloa humidicola]